MNTNCKGPAALKIQTSGKLNERTIGDIALVLSADDSTKCHGTASLRFGSVRFRRRSVRFAVRLGSLHHLERGGNSYNTCHVLSKVCKHSFRGFQL